MNIGYYYPAPFPSLNADIVNIVQMCRAFAALGHEVTLFIPRDERFADSESAMQEAYNLFSAPLGFHVVFLSRHTLWGRMQMLGSLLSARRALKNHVLDLIYTRAPWACLLLPFQHVPFILELHEVELHRESRVLTKLLQRITVWASRHKNCRRFVVISGALGQVWRRLGVPVQRIKVAHDAVDLELFDGSQSKSDARKQLGIESTRPLLVYTGSLYADRGIELILESASRIPEADFYLVGGARSEVESYRQEASSRKIQNVLFMGQVPHREIPQWLAAGDILLMMWTWRVKTMAICSPMKLFEYMAANRLIVGPAFPTIEEVVRNGEHALLFEPDNVDKMIECIRLGLTSHKQSLLPQRARALVEQHYTWEKRCKAVLEA